MAEIAASEVGMIPTIDLSAGNGREGVMDREFKAVEAPVAGARGADVRRDARAERASFVGETDADSVYEHEEDEFFAGRGVDRFALFAAGGVMALCAITAVAQAWTALL